MGLLGFGRMPGGVAAILELRSLRIRWAAGRGKTFRAVEIGVMSLFLLPSCRSRDEYTETVCFAGKKGGIPGSLEERCARNPRPRVRCGSENDSAGGRAGTLFNTAQFQVRNCRYFGFK